MARFVFELQSVLEHRRRQEREHQRRVAELDRHRLWLESRIEAARRSIEDEREAMRSVLAGGGGPIDPAAARAQLDATSGLQHQLQRRVLELERARERAESARAGLRQATARRKAVEALRDRRYEAWKRERARREQAELDDISGGRAARGITSEDVA